MLRFETRDLFTDTPFAGNPLAIVRGADGLTTNAMQTIAREFNLSETIFVQPPDDPGHTAKVRIFFPTAEIPFAGHPTIGCAIHLATDAAPDGDFETTITLEEVAGLVPVQVLRRAGRITAEFRAPVIPTVRGGATDPGRVAAALDLSASDIGLPGHVATVCAAGPVFHMVPIASPSALARARPIEPHWSEVGLAAGTNAMFLYTPDPSGAADYLTRMYAPTDGIPEDPATGSASAILARQLLSAGALTEGRTTVRLLQGRDMGRPSDIRLTASVANSALEAVHIAGTAVRISRGEIRLP